MKTYRIAAGSERYVGHVVAGDQVVALQRTDLQTAAVDRQSHIAAGVLHVRSIAQYPLDPPIDLFTHKRDNIFKTNISQTVQTEETNKY